jgi:hypothetical protein
MRVREELRKLQQETGTQGEKLNQLKEALVSCQSLPLDVFNVLNSQEVVASNEHYESSTGTRNQYYGAAYGFQTPRYVQLGFEARF